MESSYSMAADILRTLTVAEPLVLEGSDQPLRSVLRTAAGACERIEELQVPSESLARVAELEGLLARVADVLEAEPLPVEGGSWAVATVAQEIRRVLQRP